MRELKFRIWDNGYFRYVTIKDLLNWLNSGDVFITSQDRIIEQYTTLKDKNGIELYEGDIVQFRYRCNMNDITGNGYIKWYIPNKTSSNELYYGDAGYIINRNIKNEIIKIENYLSLYMINDKIKIGNIHEHSELLK